MSISVNPKTVRAIALDLDGTTLAPGAVLTERTIKAVAACRNLGIEAIIATGRAIEAAERFRAALGADGPSVYFNGAVVADMPEGSLLSTTLMDLKSVEFCIDLARETGVYYQAYFPGTDDNPGIKLLTEQDSPEREMYHKHTGILAELGDLKEAIGRPGLKGCVKTMYLAEPEVQDVIRPRLLEHLGASAYIARTTRTFLEVMDARVSKGQGLKTAMKLRSLKKEEVIAFGDEENDLPMFDFVDFSAAPENAKENVKARANLIIGSNAEDGLAAFLEDFFKL